ncbi:Methyltransf-25 domain-containing protein [Mycena chlorophos]|uniref:Methyltransf-25 domain-containing protein n=1 Tax=Mycena chlorophos TaxID=658473 RepID=A0A8H6T1E4_MYCCL|nr:Methyltransf-25 domain-containing protein [Mycena chlorophos]
MATYYSTSPQTRLLDDDFCAMIGRRRASRPTRHSSSGLEYLEESTGQVECLAASTEASSVYHPRRALTSLYFDDQALTKFSLSSPLLFRMATFAKMALRAAAQAAAAGPSYPPLLFNTILSYHQESLSLPGSKTRWKHALDLSPSAEKVGVGLIRPLDGSGAGFERVTCLDPNEGIVDEGTDFATSLGDQGSGLAFLQRAAENLEFLQDESVDLFVSAQANSLDWKRLWPELSRVLRHGGTLSFWAHAEMRLPRYPQLTPLLTEFLHGTDPTTCLGPYWDAEPTRKITNEQLLDIPPPPDSGWQDIRKGPFTGDYYNDISEPLAPILSQKTTWGGGLHRYLRTFSSLRRFHEVFPQDLDHPEGDIIVRFLRRLMDAAQVPPTEEGLAQEVEIEWPLLSIVMRKEVDTEDVWYLRESALSRHFSAVQEAYDKKVQQQGDPVTVEEATARYEEWRAAREQLVDLVAAEAAAVPSVQDKAATTADPEECEKFEADRRRYLLVLEQRHRVVYWRPTFKFSFGLALNLAKTVTEITTCEAQADPAVSVELWVKKMEQRVAKLKEDLPEVTPLTLAATGSRDLDMLTQDELATYEMAHALETLVTTVRSLAVQKPDASIGEIVETFYTFTTGDLTRTLITEDELDFARVL